MTPIERLIRNAKNGNLIDCLQLIRIYAKGNSDIFKDLSSAKKWAEKAFEIIRNSPTDYRGGKYNLSQLEYKGKQGDFESCIELALYFATGSSNLFTDMVQARKWMAKALGLDIDTYDHVIESASDNVNVNYKELSISGLKTLANNGDRDACIELSKRYITGSTEVFRDDALSNYWLKKAAEITVPKKKAKRREQTLHGMTKEDVSNRRDNLEIESDLENASLEKTELNAKDAVLKQYQSFLNALQRCNEKLACSNSSDSDFVKIIGAVKAQFEQEIKGVETAATEAINSVVWDHLVIAFFGETNAGKSTIIETFRILFDEQTRKDALAKNPQGVDGEIVGDGQSDFTKVYSEYDMSIKGKPFTLIDVPGIEGNEDDFKDEIKKALGKAHLVFYVQGENKQPDTKTAEKIKKYLRDWVNVYSIYNVRGNAGSYKDDETRQTLHTPDVEKTENLIKDTFAGILGDQYKGNISLQGLLALCSVAEFSERRTDLKRKQNKLESYFASKDNMLQFSCFKNLEELIFNKCDNFKDEITEANKQKLIALGKKSYHDIESVLKQNSDELTKYKNELSSFRIYVGQSYRKTKSKIKSITASEYDSMFQNLRSRLYQFIDDIKDDKAKKDDCKQIINNEAIRFNQRLGRQIKAEIYSLHNRIESRKRSLTINRMVDSTKSVTIGGMSMELGNALGELDINFKDVLGWAADTVEFGAIGGVIGSSVPVIGTFVGAIVGGIVGNIFHFAKVIFYGDGGTGKAKEKIRKQLTEESNKLYPQIKDEVESKVLDPLDSQKAQLVSLIKSKEQTLESSLQVIDKGQNTLKNLIRNLNRKDYGTI